MALNYSKSTVGGVILYSGIGEPPYQLGKKGDLFVRTDRPNMYIHYGVDAGWGNFNVNGYTGSAGSLGYVGSIGYTGSRGVSTNIRGTVSDIGSLPPSPERGDAYIVGTDLYVFDNTDNWVNVGRIIGDLGYTGSVGFTGSIGIGYTGSQGMAGFMGYTGSQGDNGINGYTGSAGINGYTGSAGAGYTGSAGINGYTGSLGYTGSAGAGYTGSAGITGFTGSGGLGYTGSAGAGYTGSAGITGFTGSGGLGYTGSAGAGYTGSRGDTGFTGSGGLGYTGSAGAGYTGSAGSAGGLGYTGSQGVGFTGSQGYTGSMGGLPSYTGNAKGLLTVDDGETTVSWQKPGFISVSNITDAGYTVAASGVGTYIRITSATGQTINIPTDVAVNLGGTFTFRQGGAGKLTFSGGVGVTINSAETLISRKQGSTVTLIKTGVNIWDILGDLEASA